MQVFDHLTSSAEGEEVWTSLCGLSEDDLPKAPLCPRCDRIQRQTRRPVRRLFGTVFLRREEPAAHR